MFLKKVFSTLLTLLAICFVVFVVALTINLMPTRGEKITEYANPQKALLVIDIQRDFTAPTAQPPFPYENAGDLILTLNELTQEAAQKNITVIYLRQEFSGFFGELFSRIFCKGKGIKGKQGTEFDERLTIVSNHIFSKPKGDAFSNPKFEAFLIGHQIDELYLTGLDAEFCVYHTVKGAINRGYRVNILTDVILLLNKEKWDNIMERYRKNGIRLQSSGELIKRVVLDKKH